MHLKPCPFCGTIGAAVIKSEVVYTIVNGQCKQHYIECLCCESRGPKEDIQLESIELWNKRINIWPPTRKFFCSKCNKALEVKREMLDEEKEHVWVEPCSECNKDAKTEGVVYAEHYNY